MIILKNNIITFELNPDNTTFSIYHFDKIAISDATFTTNINNQELFPTTLLIKDYKKYKTKDNIGEKEEVVISYLLKEELILNFYTTLYKNAPYLIIRLAAINNTDKNMKINCFKPFISSYHKNDNLIFYKQGFQSWSPSIPLKLTQQDIKGKYSIVRKVIEPLDRKPQKDNFISDGMTIIHNKQSKETLLLGFITFFKQLPFIEVNTDKDISIQAISHTYDYELKKKEELSSELFFIEKTDDKQQALNDYIKLVKIYMNPRSSTTPPTGWCSWYYYFNKLMQEDVIKNINILKNKKNYLPVEYIQIDDGYQNDIGDWLIENKKFSSLRELANNIKEAGFTPGIWLAPFIIKKTSHVYKQHRDWLLKDKYNRDVIVGINPFWGGTYYALDLTKKEVIGYLQEVFHKLTKDYGYKYLKLDFLFAPFVTYDKYKNNTTPVEVYRNALSKIREVIPEDVFILGCGAPLFHSIGLVDAMRVSIDVSARWLDLLSRIFTLSKYYATGVKNCIVNSANRYFTNNNFFINDPDCVLLRDTKTKLTEDEIKTFLSFVGLYGGSVFISDNLEELKDERLKLFSMLLPPHNLTPTVFDFLDEAEPSLVGLKHNNYLILGIFNLKDKPININIDLNSLNLTTNKQYIVFELWSRKVFNISNNIKFDRLSPHTCKILSITEVSNAPHILATDFHISCGIQYIKYTKFVGDTFLFELNTNKYSEGKIYVYLPEDFKIKTLETNAEYYYYKKIEENILEITAKINKQAKFKLLF